MAKDIDQVLDKLARDVEIAVHALYRGEVHSATAKVRTGHLVRAAAAEVRARGWRGRDEVRDRLVAHGSPGLRTAGLQVHRIGA